MAKNKNWTIKLILDAKQFESDFKKAVDRTQRQKIKSDKLAEKSKQESMARTYSYMGKKEKAAYDERDRRDKFLAKSIERNKKSQAGRDRAAARDAFMGGEHGRVTQQRVDLNDLKNRANRKTFTHERAGAIRGKIGELEGLGQRLKTAKTNEQLIKIRKEYGHINAEINKIVTSQDRYNRSLRKSSRFLDKFKQTAVRAGLQLASVYAAVAVAQKAFTVGKEMDSMRAALLAASDDAESAGENFEFLKETASVLGKDIQTLTGSFNRVALAAKASGFDANQTKEIFLAAAESSTAFGLTNEKTSLIMLAMSQIMSKGRVSMEEMSRQLGENLPTALKAMATATGTTRKELIKLIETGKLLPEDVMLPFAKELRRMARLNGALAAGQKKLISQQNRMNNAFKVMVDKVFQDGVAEKLGDLFAAIGKGVENLTPFIKSLIEVIVDTTAVVIRAIKSFIDLTGVLSDNNKEIGALSRVWYGFVSVIYAALAGIELLAAAKEKLTDFGINIDAIANPALSGLGVFSQASGLVSQMSNTTKTNSLHIENMNLSTTSNNPQDHAEEVMGIINDRLGLL